MRAKLPRLIDRVAVDGRLGIGVELGGVLVGDLRELEREKHHVAATLRARFAHAREQATGGVVLCVLAMQHVRVDLCPRRRLFVIGQLPHHGRERFRLQGRDLSFVCRLEGLRSLEVSRERSFDLRIVGRREETA